MDRRAFIATTGLAGVAAAAGSSRASGHVAERAAGSVAAYAKSRRAEPGDEHRGVVSMASGNGVEAVRRAYELMGTGSDPCEAVVAGVGIVEADPNDMSVGYGGLPNEDGVVQLDSSVMHGPTNRAGAVAAIEEIMHPAAVALEVLKRTDHCMIVGRGATEFAVSLGYKRENLLTDRAREAWIKWKSNLNPNDDWLDEDQRVDLDSPAIGAADGEKNPLEPAPFTYGTIHCSGVNSDGDVGACTTTSGLSWKIPGRVGDSPIIGAGMFVDNEVGSAGATGRGEAVIQSCGAFLAVRKMEEGMTPTEACLAVLEHIAKKTKMKHLKNERGEPNFGVTMYAMRKDGAYGSACMHPGGSFAVATEAGAERIRSVPLFER